MDLAQNNFIRKLIYDIDHRAIKRLLEDILLGMPVVELKDMRINGKILPKAIQFSHGAILTRMASEAELLGPVRQCILSKSMEFMGTSKSAIQVVIILTVLVILFSASQVEI